MSCSTGNNRSLPISGKSSASILSIMLGFFDFLLIGFTLAFFVRDWNLTYGQSGAILLASGVSAPVCGSIRKAVRP